MIRRVNGDALTILYLFMSVCLRKDNCGKRIGINLRFRTKRWMSLN